MKKHLLNKEFTLILKDKKIKNKSENIKQAAGDRQEQDVAYYLGREFKYDKDVFVLNDLRFEKDGDVAQIDHLILYKYGFVIIESKSIYGEVRVNESGEWSRSYKNEWIGMKSPIQQAKLQMQLLRKVLNDNAENLLGKIFGSVQKYFGGRQWDKLCAISSSAIFDRDNVPKNISESVVKSEFLTELVLQKIKTKGVFSGLSTPTFSQLDMEKVAQYILDIHKDANSKEKNKNTSVYANSKEPKKNTNVFNINTLSAPLITCKKCSNGIGLIGKYKSSYYVFCPSCETNTAMKSACNNCGSKSTKIKKSKSNYSLECNDCSSTYLVHKNSSTTHP